MCWLFNLPNHYHLSISWRQALTPAARLMTSQSDRGVRCRIKGHEKVVTRVCTQLVSRLEAFLYWYISVISRRKVARGNFGMQS
jgi:hypothetical protein